MPACVSAHAGNGGGCSQIEAINAAVLSSGVIIQELPMVLSQVEQGSNKNTIVYTLRRACKYEQAT